MQSGKKSTKKWLLLPIENHATRSINPLMGWVSSNDTKTQLKFEFTNKEAAVDFAISQGFEYEVEEPNIASIKNKSYAQNFG